MFTFISILFFPYAGVILLRDLDFLLGSIIGILFAFKYRKPNQTPLKLGILVGNIGGFVTATGTSIFVCTIFQYSIYWFFFYLFWLSITGFVVGSIVGVLFGFYYKKKDAKAKYLMDDEFYQGFIVK